MHNKGKTEKWIYLSMINNRDSNHDQPRSVFANIYFVVIWRSSSEFGLGKRVSAVSIIRPQPIHTYSVRIKVHSNSFRSSPVEKKTNNNNGTSDHHTRFLSCLQRWTPCNTSKRDAQYVGFLWVVVPLCFSSHLEKYPQIKQLMGSDPWMTLPVVLSVVIQVTLAILVRDLSWGKLLLVAYVIGGTINHSLSLAMHELSHNLAFGHSKPWANRLLGFLANLPLGVPASITFKKYHLEHHR